MSTVCTSIPCPPVPATNSQADLMLTLSSSFYWAFIVGPKDEPAGFDDSFFRIWVRRDAIGRWFCKRDWPDTGWNITAPDARLLCRVRIGKIVNNKHFYESLLKVDVSQHDQTWRSRSWVADAITSLRENGKAMSESSILDFDLIATVLDRMFVRMVNQVYHDESRPTGNLFDLIQGGAVHDMLGYGNTAVAGEFVT